MVDNQVFQIKSHFVTLGILLNLFRNKNLRELEDY